MSVAMSLALPSHTRRPRANSHGNIDKIPVDASLENQTIYNQIREDEERHHLQQHVAAEDRLRPTDPRAPPMARSVTNESQISAHSLSPASTTDVPDYNIPTIEVPPTAKRRPRGRRAGPLCAEKRFKTAIKRKLGLVCERCKQKKVVCDHYDLSKLEEAYQAGRSKTQTAPLKLSPASTDYLGLEDSRAPTPSFPGTEDLASDLKGLSTQPHNRQEDIYRYINSFSVSDVSFGNRSARDPFSQTFDQSYSPGLSSSGPPSLIVPAAPFPVGSEMPGYPTRWRCDHRRPGFDLYPQEDACSWTGPLQELEAHFSSEHFAFQGTEYWCHCMTCSSLTYGWNPPKQCTESRCCGQLWKRCLYGTTSAGTAPIAQSVESESVFSFDARIDQSQSPYA
ncbi:hypothetical protein BJ166DRAFT_368334 [Pestalotiopsis sp. NC0098]|nr:hypothetical protein BJ166DRAFT_368334 [Pestalotiopsis sp. NC0098]